MLFSNTLVVEARYGKTLTITQTFNVSLYPQSSTITEGTFASNYGSGSITLSGRISGSVSTTTGTVSESISQSGSFTLSGSLRESDGVNYIDMPLHLGFQCPQGFLKSNFTTNYVRIQAWNLSYSTSEGSLINGDVLYSDGESFIGTRDVPIDKYIYTYSDGINISPRLYFDGNLSYAYQDDNYTSPISFTITCSFVMAVAERYDAEYVRDNSQVTTNPNAEQKLDDLNTSTDAIEQSVTSDTGGGILATIKNFFGSFFQNVFDTLVSVFVPEDGFFSDWFNRLNTLLSEKLGMLYAPFDLLVTTLNAIMNADTTDTGIPFPGIQWEDTYLVEPFTFYFSSLGDTFTDLQGYVYFATDTVLLFAFLYLLQNKIRLILEGHESG